MSNSDGGNAHKLMMPLLIESIITGDKLIFKSKNQCAIYLNVNPAMFYFVAKRQNGINYVKTKDNIFTVRNATEEDIKEIPMTLYPENRGKVGRRKKKEVKPDVENVEPVEAVENV